MRHEDNYWVKRLQSGQLSRRRFVGGAAIAGVGAASLGLVGCGDDDDKSSSTPTTAGGSKSPAAGASASATAAPKKGGVYNVGFTGPFAGVHPFNSVYGGSGIIPEVYNYLFRNSLLAPDKGNVLDLATKSAVQSDNITWVFNLRNDAKIAPNKYGVPERPLDANDIKASFDFIADKSTGSNAYAFFNVWVDKINVIDPQTFQLVTKKPYAFTEASLGNPLTCPIVPKEWVAKGADQMKADSVGAGAFTLKTLVENSNADMVPNPNYWDKEHPYIDQYTIKSFADQATYRAAFQSKQIDVYGPADKDEGEALKNAEKGVIHSSDPGLGYLSFWVNTKSKPWDDPRVRRAVNRATDRTEYIQIIGTGPGEPIGPVTYAFKNEALSPDELKQAQPFDVNGAKTLFQQAGIKELTFSHPTSSNVNDYVNIFVRQMQAAGVTAKPQPLDAGTWVAGYFASTLTASLSLNQTYNTPNDALQWFHSGGITGNNKYDTGWSDPDVDKAIDGAAGTLDPTARAKAYHDTQKLILSKDPAFFNFFGLRTEVVYRNFIENYPVGLSSLGNALVKTVWLNK
jgi:peptide/nickel transport system substrate-binding protein